jgi:hypothetical protein
MRAKEREWIVNACGNRRSCLQTFLDQAGGQAKQSVRWDGRAETRESAIAAMVARVRDALP